MLAEEARLSAGRLRLSQAGFSADQFVAIGAFLEAILIISVSVATGLVYHLLVHDHAGAAKDFLLLGVLVALLNALPSAVRSQYHAKTVLPGERGYMQVFRSWNFAFFCIAVLGFITKSTEEQSRGWLILLYSIGLVGVAGLEGIMNVVREAAIRSGRLTTRRLLLVGTRGDIERFAAKVSSVPSGIKIAAAAQLPGAPVATAGYNEQVDRCIASALNAARAHNVTDIVVLADWAGAPRLAQLAENLMDIPATVHLGGLGVVDKFADLGVAQLGTVRTIVLRRQPMGLLRSAAKRIVDVAVSGFALVALAPVFLLVAALIKFDTPGPVFFRQRRRGFNQKEFRIWKFRTMVTADDGDRIVQATEGDARVTRVGRLLRKWNIDELPQLINVLKGDMSLVGPRPHAVAHDWYYERIVERYGRRLNVKPGITGWAQIHGHRGPTTTKAAMQARVAHDLYYIEHCSVTLDLYIMLMTVLSPRAYRNAL